MKTTERRQIILVPTERDMTDPTYLSKYWPNFVCAVTEALRNNHIDARIYVSVVKPQEK